jgi:hypothetical protein
MGLVELLFFGWLLSESKKRDALKPGMTGLLAVPVPPAPGFSPHGQSSKPVGMVAIQHFGVLGWTNVQPSENATVRAGFSNGARVVIRSGNAEFHAMADGDGPQGGKFFRAL